MSKAKGHKKQRQRARARSKVQSKAKKALTPGILQSWEDFDEAAMREYLAAVADEVEQQMDELEQALRCEN